ncbi:MAG: hypothetical protein WB622_15195, partial [Acidobacteriaceae bacterium]
LHLCWNLSSGGDLRHAISVCDVNENRKPASAAGLKRGLMGGKESKLNYPQVRRTVQQQAQHVAGVEQSLIGFYYRDRWIAGQTRRVDFLPQYFPAWTVKGHVARIAAGSGMFPLVLALSASLCIPLRSRSGSGD